MRESLPLPRLPTAGGEDGPPVGHAAAGAPGPGSLPVLPADLLEAGAGLLSLLVQIRKAWSLGQRSILKVPSPFPPKAYKVSCK